MVFPVVGGTQSTGYDIANSARFGNTGTFLTRSQSDNESDADRRKFTISGWYKQTGQGSASGWNGFWSAMVDSNNYTSLKKNNNGDAQLIFELKLSGTGKTFTLTQKIRDFTAWYHIVASFDSTDGTAADRLKIYVNGERAAGTFSADITQNDSAHWGDDASAARLGAYNNNTGNAYMHNGYMADVCMTVGYALGPEKFGKTNDNGIWVPISPQVTYSANGFLCEFKQSGTSANSSGIGADTSGNDNHFTIDETDNADIGQAVDSPTNNFATFNPMYGGNTQTNGYRTTLSLGNLQAASQADGKSSGVSTFGVANGKWYAEFKQTASSHENNYAILGVHSDLTPMLHNNPNGNGVLGYSPHGYGYWGYNATTSNGNKMNDDSSSNYGESYDTDDIIGLAIDLDNGAMYVSKNGTWQASSDPTSGASKTNAIYALPAASTKPDGFYFMVVGDTSSSQTCTWQANFGGSNINTISSGNADANGYGNFEYAVPSGYYALCTKNLAEYG